MSIEKMAQALAGFGRYGDSELVHMNPEEVRILEQLAGQRMTTNPVTGRQEAFAFLVPLLATLAGSLGSKFISDKISGDKKKTQDVPASDARKYVDALYERRRKEAEERGFPIISLESTGPQPLDLLGREQTASSPPAILLHGSPRVAKWKRTMTTRNPPSTGCPSRFPSSRRNSSGTRSTWTPAMRSAGGA